MSERKIPQAAAVPREVLGAARERGWKFFPVEARGKKPLIKGWQQAATNDAAQLAAWRASFDGCNFGWPIPEGFFVLDADGREGKLALAALEAVNGPLPKALTIKTGNGTHRVFSCDAAVRNSASRVAPKVDVRGSGGYIVFAGSIHPNGKRYTIEDAAPVAPAPEWLIVKATQETQAAAPAADGVIPLHTRNATLTSKAGTMRRKDMSEAAILAALREENKKCSPPLADKDLQTIARSVARYAPAEAANAAPWPEPEGFGAPLPPVDTLTPDMLPAALRDWCIDQSANLQVPLDYCGAVTMRIFTARVTGTLVRRWRPSIWPGKGLAVSAETLRRWLRASGQKGVRKCKPYRQRRERRKHFGELVQMDGSFHEWLEERGERGCLMHMVDDATSTAEARFYPRRRSGRRACCAGGLRSTGFRGRCTRTGRTSTCARRRRRRSSRGKLL